MKIFIFVFLILQSCKDCYIVNSHRKKQAELSNENYQDAEFLFSLLTDLTKFNEHCQKIINNNALNEGLINDIIDKIKNNALDPLFSKEINNNQEAKEVANALENLIKISGDTKKFSFALLESNNYKKNIDQILSYKWTKDIAKVFLYNDINPYTNEDTNDEFNINKELLFIHNKNTQEKYLQEFIDRINEVGGALGAKIVSYIDIILDNPNKNIEEIFFDIDKVIDTADKNISEDLRRKTNFIPAANKYLSSFGLNKLVSDQKGYIKNKESAASFLLFKNEIGERKSYQELIDEGSVN